MRASAELSILNDLLFLLAIVFKAKENLTSGCSLPYPFDKLRIYMQYKQKKDISK